MKSKPLFPYLAKRINRLFLNFQVAYIKVRLWRESLFETKENTKNSTASQPHAEQKAPEANPQQEPLQVSYKEWKSQRWEEYQGKGGEWDYERWSKTYNDNMKRALQSNISVNKYHREIGWGNREVTIEVNGKLEKLDIADVDAMKGIEVLSGKYCSKSQEILGKITRDETLIKKGWDISWKIEGKASQPLLEELKRVGITLING